MTTTSLLQTALQNLHVSQQLRDSAGPSSPRLMRRGLSSNGSSPSISDDEEDGDVLINVGKGTAPGTPLIGQKGLILGQKIPSSLGGQILTDPLKRLPTVLAVRVFLQLDIRSLARCDRVSKRWHKSSTLNYVWFLQNRALTLPSLTNTGPGGKTRTLEDGTEFFDPYEKTRGLAALPMPPFPTSATPQWSKAESKKTWKGNFKTSLKRNDPDAPEEIDPRRVTIESLGTSGYSTPNRHAHAGSGSGGADKWATISAPMTPTERKVAAREAYKAMSGRKARGKRKMGGELGARDKGGAVADDGRFDAPW